MDRKTFRTRKSILFALSAIAFFQSTSHTHAKDQMLYEMSIEDLSDQILNDITAKEEELIYRQKRATPGSTRAKENEPLNIVLLFDVSRSVVNKSAQSGAPMSKIKKEVVSLVDSLPPSTRFNVVQFTRNYLPFKESVVPADATNRTEFQDWVNKKWNDSGTLSSANDGAVKNPKGIIGVLQFAERMHPDAVYLISDGSFEQGPADEAEKVEWSEAEQVFSSMSESDKKTAINFIAFAPDKSDAQQMERIAKSSGGVFRTIASRGP